MVRIAVSSDNHLDINRQNVDTLLKQQAHWLQAATVDYYLIVGDLFNDFQKTISYVEHLQALLPQTQVYFVAGNHDMGRHITELELETYTHPNYLHNRYIDLPNSDWRLIGLNGWYDYGFAPELPTKMAIDFHRSRFYDRMIDQHDSDQERYRRAFEQLKQQLEQGINAQKEMIVMTHFVPIADDLLTNTSQNRQLVNAMMGSPKTGHLLEQYPDVKWVFFGHAHVQSPLRQHQQVQYLNVSVGVGRRNEWLADNFLASWEERLKILTL